MKIRRPDDFHVHFRSAEALKAVAPYTARVFARALLMPNLTPPVHTAEDVIRYRDETLAATEKYGFTPLMTIKLGRETTPATVKAAKRAGAIAAKFYPEGMTTNASGGYTTLEPLYDVVSAMQDENMVLCIHGEAAKGFSMDREALFTPEIERAAAKFPGLRIVFEHITTAAAVDFVESMPRSVAATITPHHLFLTLDDIVGGMLNPHAFCKPIAKRPEDRGALIDAAVSGNPKFFFGSDTAPHLEERKTCAGCAGVYCAPTALESLADVFETHDSLGKLEAFVSIHGANFYQLPWNEDYIELVDEAWEVPEKIDGYVPFRAGQRLKWRARPVA